LILDIGARPGASVCEIAFVLTIFSHVCSLPPDLYSRFLLPEVPDFLHRLALSPPNPGVLSLSLSCICALTHPTKPAGAALLPAALELCLGLAPHSREHPLASKVVPALLALLSNCLAGPPLDDAAALDILAIFADFCESEYAVWAVEALANAVFYAPEQVLPFLDAEWLARLLQLLEGADDALAGQVFAALDNVAFCDERAALRVIDAGLFTFEAPTGWTDATFWRYCRVVWTLTRRLGEYRSAVRDEMSEGCMCAVRERAQTLVPALVAALEDAPCQVRQAAASALCAIVNLNDGELLHIAMQGNLRIVENLVELLLVKDAALASAMLCALLRLCEFGDRIAFATENVFLVAAKEAEIDDVLPQVAEIYADEAEIQDQLHKLGEEIARSRDHEEIDLS
jgi:hypothetical protein